jgi:uncharacterized protein YbaP (TraB family)
MYCMRKGSVLGVCLGLAVVLPVLWAAEPPSPPGPMAEVLVSGELPGPGMWRVSKGDHTLWILATLVPLPRRMTWRSHSVEKRIASSQVVLAPPEIVADVGFFDDPLYLGAVRRAEKNPNKETLDHVLTPELYNRWSPLRTRFIDSSYDEHARPIIAARDLFQHVVYESGLTMEETVWEAVVKVAHRHRVKIFPVVVQLEMDSPDDWIREFTQIPLDQELTCLEKTMARIETDLGAMRHRANLWAIGDVDGLLALTFPDERVACFNALFSVPRLQNQLADAGRQLDDEWLVAVDSALMSNESTFTVLPLGQLLGQEGWLAKLRARGYSVQDPDGRD